FAGYHKQPEKTAEALDHDGWLHTGDVGLWDERGRLRIIDRVKNLVKLSQGEYVALERVENVFVGHPVVAQMLLYGDSLKSFLVSVIVPDEEALRAFVAEKVPVLGSAQNAMGFAQLCQHPLVRDAVVSDLGVWGRRAGLNGYEVPRNVHLTTEPFTPENAILTPTLKLKRNVARDVFKKHIEEIDNSNENG
ncbi:acetyl-CoA synthetase-like protein, partial [Ramicandelaber brevisporus]